MKPKHWTKEEDDYILANHGRLSYGEIGIKLGRTKSSIANRYYVINLKLNGRSIHTKDELYYVPGSPSYLQKLKKKACVTNEDLAGFTGMTSSLISKLLTTEEGKDCNRMLLTIILEDICYEEDKG